MGTIYEKIKAAKESSALKANAALIAGAADAAPTYQDLSVKPVKSNPVKTDEENKDDGDVDDVVNTDENNENDLDPASAGPDAGGGASPADYRAPVKIISALKYGKTPAKNVKDEVKKSMGKGFVGDTFGDVTETTTTTTGGVKGPGYEDKMSDEDWIKYLETETDEQRNKRYEREVADGHREKSTVDKKYDVKENEEKVETTTPGEKSNYNMGWASSVNAKWAEGVQKRDANQDLRQFNKYSKKFDKGRADGVINPTTGKPFTSATEYADFRMGKSEDRRADGNMDATQEFNQGIDTRRGRDKAPETNTTTKKEEYDEAKHGKKDDITYKDSSVTSTAEVVDDDAPAKFTLRKKSKALKNFKFKK